MKNKLVFVPNGTNEIASISDTAYISFNKDVSKVRGMLRECASDGSNSTCETALVLMSADPTFRNRKYYILNGDFRKEYAEAFDAGGLEACNELFNKLQPEHGNEWSTATDQMKFLQMLINKILGN